MKKGINNTIAVKQVLGERLKNARKEKKMTRLQLAKAMCASPKSPNETRITREELEERLVGRIRQWESGANPTDIEWIPAICGSLGCDAGYLFGEYECRDYDTQFIQNETGLSEDAISALRKYDENTLDFISFLLASGAIVPLGLKASQCVDTKLKIRHYHIEVLPQFDISDELEQKAIKEWNISEQYLDIEQKRTKVMDEIKRLDTEYTALLWRCNQDFGVSVETFIDEEVKKYG